MKSTFEDIRCDLEKLFPKVFIDSPKEPFNELKSMHFPKDFAHMYAKRNPNKVLEFGRFRLFRIEELIDENIWAEPGEVLYQMGFSIVGETPEGQFYCLNMKETNSTGNHDVLLVDHEFTCDPADVKGARARMKFMANNLVDLMARELAFLKKKRSSR